MRILVENDRIVKFIRIAGTVSQNECRIGLCVEERTADLTLLRVTCDGGIGRTPKDAHVPQPQIRTDLVEKGVTLSNHFQDVESA